MNIPPRFFRSFGRATGIFLLGAWLVGGGGCTFLHNYGSGTHLDAPPDKAPPHGNAKASTMQVEITTDAAAQVTMIHFVKSSGSDAVDGFVADSLRHTWPGRPAPRALGEIRYAPGPRFCEPKLISSIPAA